MSEQEKIGEYQQRYVTALHAMQAGVAVEMNYNPAPTTPKHLRVGVNSAMVNDKALVEALVEKGVITMEDYWRHLAEAAEAEAQAYTDRLSDMMGGVKVTLI